MLAKLGLLGALSMEKSPGGPVLPGITTEAPERQRTAGVPAYCSEPGRHDFGLQALGAPARDAALAPVQP